MLGIHQSFLNPMSGIILTAEKIGADCLQIFIRSNRGGKRRDISRYEINEFNTLLLNSNVQSVVIHAPYYMNPCTEDKTKRNKYLSIIQDDLRFLSYLAGDVRYVLHPGSSLDLTEDCAMNNLIEFVKDLAPCLFNTKLAVEMMAGAGTQMLSSYVQLAIFYEAIKNLDNIGFCLDTCHTFGAGLDSMKIYDAYKNKIFVAHLNNSAAAFGTHVDRHANINAGQISTEYLVDFARQVKTCPMILETPHPEDLIDYTFLIESLKR